jgi:hypothetical protein
VLVQEPAGRLEKEQDRQDHACEGEEAEQGRLGFEAIMTVHGCGIGTQGLLI